jgi:GTP cyclohydrolase I
MRIVELTGSLPEHSASARHRSLRVVPSRDEVDLPAVERAVADLLVALGKDPTSEHLSATPRRVAHSYAELLTPREFDLTTFPNDEGYDELVLAKNIPVHSLCEHHLLPFHGIAHIGYLPGERILGLSKLARVVDLFARDLQVQERLTPAGRRRAAGAPGAQRRRRGDRGRAPVHVTARRPSHRLAHRHLSTARAAT